jgi:hypothetical protein
MKDGTTFYGFNWGPMEVMRACADGRYRTVLIRTGDWEVQVSVSPTGRAVHVSKQRLQSTSTDRTPENRNG